MTASAALERQLDAAGPLQGIRVLDLSSVIMGPFATQTLGDMGAEIITVETVEGGGNRNMGAGPHDEFSGIALNLLRNKRSICLDMKHPKGREAVLRARKNSSRSSSSPLDSCYRTVSVYL